MALTILDGNAYFALAMPLKDFPQLLEDFLNKYPDTPEIEVLGANLAQLNFPADGTEVLVTRVLKWAGKQGIRKLSTVLKENTPTEIADVLRSSSVSLNQGQFMDALSHVDKLRQFDVSFASKHLRFLRPDICPAFDSVLRQALPYRFDANGYSDFAQDSASLAHVLATNQIPNPYRANGVWFVADVEAAIFTLAVNHGFTAL